MKPLLTLFDVAISKLSTDIKNSISIGCANMTLFAWTVTYNYSIIHNIVEQEKLGALHVLCIYYIYLKCINHIICTCKLEWDDP